MSGDAFEILASDRTGLLADITTFVTNSGGSVNYFQSWSEYDGAVRALIQIVSLSDPQQDADFYIKGLSKIKSIKKVLLRPSFRQTYGKRVIVLGGGAQVAQVAHGAIAEADRHNIRGETISIDTVAVVGEKEVAQAVRAVGRLHRAAILVLAGSLMGGDITVAVNELRREYGIPVIALNMAGSVTKAADLVVSDPTEAGVMSVMLISHIGQFNLLQVHGKKF
ncbi:MAG: hypothetical protein E4H36_07460 [Spirochaetales bacterium]|nr:MAG: hypothetical protein E4H36_07460 [Spirochaetales bacterium]